MRPDPTRPGKRSLLRRIATGLRYVLWGHLLQARRERIEERAWRRNLMLAGRKMQQAQLAVTEDLDEMRGLKVHLDRVVPGLEKLDTQLDRIETWVEDFDEKLTVHREVFDAGVARIETAGVSSDDGASEREAEWEARLTSVVGEHDAALSALRAEKDEEIGRWAARLAEREEVIAAAEREAEAFRTSVGGAHAQEVEQLRALVEAQQGRAEELESTVSEARATGALRIAHLEEQLSDLRRVSETRISDLEAQNQLLVAAPTGLAGQREQERSLAAAQAEKRVAEQALTIRALEAGNAARETEHAQVLAQLREDVEWKGRLLEEQTRMLEEERAKAAEPIAPGADSSEPETRVAELEQEVRQLKDVRAEMDVLHGNEIARLRRSLRARIQELEQELAARESAASEPAEAAASETEGAVGEEDALEGQRLLEREAKLALVTRRNEELERQVSELTSRLESWGEGPADPAPLEAFGAVVDEMVDVGGPGGSAEGGAEPEGGSGEDVAAALPETDGLPSECGSEEEDDEVFLWRGKESTPTSEGDSGPFE